jgi:hypothetical protein
MSLEDAFKTTAGFPQMKLRSAAMAYLATIFTLLSFAQTALTDVSGMYAFLKQGEFVQLSVQDEKLSGFVSRFGDLDSDRGTTLDHFIKQGSLNGAELTFTTETIHGVWFEFKGRIDRGEGKLRGDEAYYVLRGKLIQYSTDPQKKISAASREVAFKSLPEGEAETK